MKIKYWQILFIVVMLIGNVLTNAQENIDFVTYGANANPKEGDDDFKQIFFIEVDEGADDSLTVELFDVDCFGENDQPFRQQFNSEFRFSLFGGSKAYTAKSITSETPSRIDLYKGDLIKELFVSKEAEYDDIWIQFAHLNKKQGEFVNGAYYFKLLVEGITGDDANVFNIRIRSTNTDGITIINYAPTIHLPPRTEPVQLRFNSKENSRVIIKNYDADGVRLFLKTPYRSEIDLTSSGDAKWKSDLVKLREFEKNEICAIEFGPGGRKYNDAIFSIKNEYGNLLPIILPITTGIPNNRPVIRKTIIHKDCNQIVFDASKSYDLDREKISVKWIFPEKDVKNEFRQVVNFPNPGTYSIFLAVKDNSNSVGSGVYQEFEVTINELPTAIAGNDILKSPNETIHFSGNLSYDTDGRIISYDWDFGDGNFGAGKRTSHSYSEPGQYNVKLTVTDNHTGICNSSVDSLIVSINATPIAIAGSDVKASIGENLTFDGSNSYDPDRGLLSYEWDFDDGHKERTKKVSHSFSKPGKYFVKLKVKDNSATKNNSSVDNLIVTVNNPPIAKAGKDIEIALNELLTLDARNSIDKDGEIIEYVWMSKDLFEKSGAVVTHTFLKPGKHEIKLEVKDNSGTNSGIAEDIIMVTVNAQPNADAGTDVYQTYAVVKFDASKSFDTDGKIVKYHWSFGDGLTSNKKNINHFYKNSGQYKVTLTVQDNSPASNNSASSEINVVINAKPIADAGPNKVVAPGETFNVSAKKSIDVDGTIELTEWTLENELISDQKDFNYSFDETGAYNIKLKVSDNSNHPEAIDFDNLVVVVNEPPTIVSSNFYKIAIGEIINFDVSQSFDSDGEIRSYEWSLNGKVISSDAKFNWKFDTIGKHTINLIVTDNSNVSNSVSKKSVDIFVNAQPTIRFISDINSCNNFVTLSASEAFDHNGDLLSYTWNLGDGTTLHGKEIVHSYNAQGTYPVVLTVDDGHNLSNSIATKQIIVKINSAPIANAGVDEIICAGDIVTLDGNNSYDADGDLLKYEWDFGDNTSDMGITVIKNYNRPGLYKVKLKVTDNSNLECNYNYDTKIIRVVEAPIAFAGEDIVACRNEEVFFNAYKSTDSDGIVNSFMWNFGDGNTGGGEKTSHVYKEPGIYKVVLTITGEQTGECDNIDIDELIVTVDEAPIAKFTYTDSVAVNSKIEFNAIESDGRGNKITNYHWSFDDTTSANGVMAYHSFAKSGYYIVELTINTDSKSDCNSSSIKKSVYVNDKPVAIAESKLFANVNQVLIFDASKSYDPNGKITKYIWNFGDGTTKEGINTFHSYRESGKYRISLTVKDETNLSNNFDTYEYFVEINSPPAGKIELPEYGFVGETIPIIGKGINDIDGKIENAVWSIGEFIDSSATNLEYVFNKSGKHNVVYRITDNKNSTTQLTKSIMIYEIPKLTAIFTHVVCLNEQIEIEANYTIDNPDIQIPPEWKLPNNRILSGNKVETKFSNSGIQKIVVSLKHPIDIYKTLVSEEFEIFVNQAPVVFISNIKSNFIGGANDNILFDASNSYDPDGDNLTYKWDMGDGNMYEGVKIFHTYLKSNTYKVTLTVSDNKDCKCSENSVSKKIKIVDR